MFPVYATDGTSYRLIMNTQFGSYIFGSFSKENSFFYTLDDGYAKLCMGMQIAKQRIASLGLDHIIGIICCRSSTEMIRVTARWVMARVKYVESFGNLPMNKRIGNTMTPVSFPSKAGSSVSTWKSIAYPWPAFIFSSFVNLLPEFYGENLSISCISNECGMIGRYAELMGAHSDG